MCDYREAGLAAPVLGNTADLPRVLEEGGADHEGVAPLLIHHHLTNLSSHFQTKYSLFVIVPLN